MWNTGREERWGVTETLVSGFTALLASVWVFRLCLFLGEENSTWSWGIIKRDTFCPHGIPSFWSHHASPNLSIWSLTALAIVLVCSCFHNKTQQTSWLNRHVWSHTLEAKRSCEVVIRVGFLWELWRRICALVCTWSLFQYVLAAKTQCQILHYPSKSCFLVYKRCLLLRLCKAEGQTKGWQLDKLALSLSCAICWLWDFGQGA